MRFSTSGGWMLAMLVAACGPEEDDSATTTTMAGSETSVGTTDMVSPTTGGGEATTVAVTTTEATTEDASSTGATSGDTGGGVGVCEAFCKKPADCGMDMNDFRICLPDCEMDLADAEPVCRAASEVVLKCYADMTCEEVAKLIAEGDLGSCADEVAAQNDACADAAL